MAFKKFPIAAYACPETAPLQPFQQHEAEITQGQISLKNVTVSFQRRHQKVTAVENVNLDIKAGEFVALLGVVNQPC